MESSDPGSGSPIKISVFTAKGGVGKTTVTAHLAGALALSGKDVTMLDIDPECNLRLLSDSGTIKVPNQKTGETSKIEIVKDVGKDYRKSDIVIADCSPAFVLNPDKIMKETDIFICPVMLSPLSIGHNAEVVNRTYQQLRSINKYARIFILVNAFNARASVTSIRLLAAIKILLEKIIKDPLLQLIHPEIVSIRESALLKNFGESPKLEFLNVAGRCYPRQDFLALADFLLENEYLTT